MHIVFIQAKFAEEQEEGRQGDCVKVVLEIQESDTDCTLISLEIIIDLPLGFPINNIISLL